MINVVVLSSQPVACAPWLIYNCLKKYASDILNVRYVNVRAHYNDGRSFPYDLMWTDKEAKDIIRNANVIHFHNTLDKLYVPLIDKKKQKVYGTVHSCPRQQNWAGLLEFCHETFVIRQPMQIKEYPELKTLPTLFDIWEHLPDETRKWDKIKIVYCPTSRNKVDHPSGKGYEFVMPALDKITKKYRNISVLHFYDKAYFENLKLKRGGHLVIDDVAGHDTFHLTALEGAAFAQSVYTGVGIEEGYPFLKTHYRDIDSYLESAMRDFLAIKTFGEIARRWVEENWNPKIQCQEYIDLYTK